MTELLVQYVEIQCTFDGYPYAWAHVTHALDCDLDLDCSCGGRPAIKDLIREQAGHRCQRCRHPYLKGQHGNGEWSPCDCYCTHGPANTRLAETNVVDNQIVFREAHWRILTVHHLDEDKANCRWWNLVALCQRCHLRMQRAVVMGRPYHYEHSDWFKPYAAGFYAWKYLGEDLEREEVLQRLPKLLALEHRFNQDALFA